MTYFFFFFETQEDPCCLHNNSSHRTARVPSTGWWPWGGSLLLISIFTTVLYRATTNKDQHFFFFFKCIFPHPPINTFLMGSFPSQRESIIILKRRLLVCKVNVFVYVNNNGMPSLLVLMKDSNYFREQMSLLSDCN